MSTESKEENNTVEIPQASPTRPSWASRISRISMFVWLAMIPTLCVIYTIYVAIIQRHSHPLISILATRTAAAIPTVMPYATETPSPMPSPVQ